MSSCELSSLEVSSESYESVQSSDVSSSGEEGAEEEEDEEEEVGLIFFSNKTRDSGLSSKYSNNTSSTSSSSASLAPFNSCACPSSSRSLEQYRHQSTKTNNTKGHDEEEMMER